MNFENYRYFIVAAEELNFTQAAKKLYLTQQALSKQIDKIEKYYNVRLFERGTVMRLTPAGECMYRNVSRLMDRERQMRRELQAIRGEEDRSLAVGISFFRSSIIMPDLITAFLRENPEVQISLNESSLNVLLDALRLGKLDCVFGYERPEDPVLVSRFVLKEYSVIAISRSLFAQTFSPAEQELLLANRLHKLRDFAKCPIVRMSEGNWFGSLLDRCSAQEQFTPRIALSSVSVPTTLACCVRGLGVAVCPALYIHQLTAQERSQLYLFQWDFAEAQQSLAILYPRSSYLTETAKKFIAYAKKHFETLYQTIFCESDAMMPQP